MKRYLTPWQKDALDEQDRQNGWGRYELVKCSDGRMRPRWQLQLAAANADAAYKVKNCALHMGRFIR